MVFGVIRGQGTRLTIGGIRSRGADVHEYCYDLMIPMNDNISSSKHPVCMGRFNSILLVLH